MGSLRSLHTEGHAERVQEDIDKAFDMWAQTVKTLVTRLFPAQRIERYT